MRKVIAASLALCTAGLAAAQQSLVVPAGHDTTDAVSQVWCAGFTNTMRQQVIVDASHLTPIVGRTITQLQLRRNQTTYAFAGGDAVLTVRLSTSPRDSLGMRMVPAQNHGTNQQTVFQGTVALPTSPAPGTQVAWTTFNTATIAFQTPFLYGGGNLCVEIEGAPGQQTTDWWPVDAAWDGTQGVSVNVGAGCGPRGQAYQNGEWSLVDEGSLVAGGTARFVAYGAPGDLACLALAAQATANVMDLEPLGMAQGCRAHVTGILSHAFSTFALQTDPGTARLGSPAQIQLPVPNSPWVLGASFASQWVELGTDFVASNGIQWTIANAVPTLGMATLQQVGLIGGAWSEPSITTQRAPVLRFTVQ